MSWSNFIPPNFGVGSVCPFNHQIQWRGEMGVIMSYERRRAKKLMQFHHHHQKYIFVCVCVSVYVCMMRRHPPLSVWRPVWLKASIIRDVAWGPRHREKKTGETQYWWIKWHTHTHTHMGKQKLKGESRLKIEPQRERKEEKTIKISCNNITHAKGFFCLSRLGNGEITGVEREKENEGWWWE